MNGLDILKAAVKACDDKRAEDLVVLNMEGISGITDYFVICHGNSDKQVQAIAQELKDQAHQLGINLRRLEGYEEGRWILVDMDDVVVHVFHKEERSYYNLERLWGDAPSINAYTELL